MSAGRYEAEGAKRRSRSARACWGCRSSVPASKTKGWYQASSGTWFCSRECCLRGARTYRERIEEKGRSGAARP